MWLKFTRQCPGLLFAPHQWFGFKKNGFYHISFRKLYCSEFLKLREEQNCTAVRSYTLSWKKAKFLYQVVRRGNSDSTVIFQFVVERAKRAGGPLLDLKSLCWETLAGRELYIRYCIPESIAQCSAPGSLTAFNSLTTVSFATGNICGFLQSTRFYSSKIMVLHLYSYPSFWSLHSEYSSKREIGTRSALHTGPSYFACSALCPIERAHTHF